MTLNTCVSLQFSLHIKHVQRVEDFKVVKKKNPAVKLMVNVYLWGGELAHINRTISRRLVKHAFPRFPFVIFNI